VSERERERKKSEDKALGREIKRKIYTLCGENRK
jgi:hypothetical protein